MNPDEIKKISLQIHDLVRKRDELMGEVDLQSDLALETNVLSIAKLYDARSFRDLQNVAAMIYQLCAKRSMQQRDYVASLKDHARMPPGILIPTFWNPAPESYFRFRVPIVISARSGVGKSTLARNIAVNNYLNKIPTVYITNEDSMSEALIGMYTIYIKLNTGQTIKFQDVELWMNETEKGNPKYKELASNVYRFAEQIKKFIRIVEAESLSMSSILLEIERTENQFGEPVKCALLDYIQLVEPEHKDSVKELRHQMIAKSRMWKNYAKGRNIVPIIISQLNDDGRTAESTQFEKDAGQWIVIERELDKDTEELSPSVTIRIKKGRRTGTGKMVCHFDGPSGAFVPSAMWRPPKESLYA